EDPSCAEEAVDAKRLGRDFKRCESPQACHASFQTGRNPAAVSLPRDRLGALAKNLFVRLGQMRWNRPLSTHGTGNLH
ncbi:MAG: hypothetical protein KJ645_13590, partial [Planctomycetes bacterium]|nr:hypothetical protein [Planctomycetota bacterium]